MPYKMRKKSNKPPAAQDLMETQQDPHPPENHPQPPKQPHLCRKSKQKPLSKKQLALVQEKLSLLSQNLRPIPLPPPTPKTLESISAHEPLFRSLGLWDFATLRLDSAAGDDLCRDLLAELIAHYDRDKHHSLVRGLRLKLSCADLGRALSLPKAPVRRSGGGADFDADMFGGAEEVAAVLLGFISDRMVLLDDAAILPDEVVAANRLLKEGKPNKVDWARIMWALVEREILVAPEKGSCYYAAHLQCLMKYQKPMLFEETGHEEEPEQLEAAMATVDEEDGDGEEVGDVGSERCGPTLCLGVGRHGDESKKSEEEEGLVSDGKDGGVEQFSDGKDAGIEQVSDGKDACVQHCLTECRDLSKEEPDEGGQMEGLEHYTVGASQHEELSKEKPEEGGRMEGVEHYTTGASQDEDLSKEELGGVKYPNLIEEEPDKRQGVENDELSKIEENKGKKVDNGDDDELVGAKFPTLERLTSSDFMQVMGTSNNLSFGLEQSNGDFLAMGGDMHNKSMGLDMGPGGSFLFGNEHKRGINEIDDHANLVHPSHQQKRFRSDQPWEHTPSVTGFEGCIKQVQHLMGKAHTDLIEKEKAYMNVQAQIQYLNEVLQQKDGIIQALEKTRMEQMRKREIEATRFNHDVKTLSNIVFGCKRAFKETQFAFSEYRRRFPMGDEAPQREGGRTGDDVGVRELVKLCSTKEEEMRHIACGMIDEFYKRWSDKFNKYATKLLQLKEDIALLKERLATVKTQNHG